MQPIDPDGYIKLGEDPLLQASRDKHLEPDPATVCAADGARLVSKIVQHDPDLHYYGSDDLAATLIRDQS